MRTGHTHMLTLVFWQWWDSASTVTRRVRKVCVHACIQACASTWAPCPEVGKVSVRAGARMPARLTAWTAACPQTCIHRSHACTVRQRSMLAHMPMQVSANMPTHMCMNASIRILIHISVHMLTHIPTHVWWQRVHPPRDEVSDLISDKSGVGQTFVPSDSDTKTEHINGAPCVSMRLDQSSVHRGRPLPTGNSVGGPARTCPLF